LPFCRFFLPLPVAAYFEKKTANSKRQIHYFFIIFIFFAGQTKVSKFDLRGKKVKNFPCGAKKIFEI
jgi:hypothetical protein